MAEGTNPTATDPTNLAELVAAARYLVRAANPEALRFGRERLAAVVAGLDRAESATVQAESAVPVRSPVILGRALQDREGDLYRWLGEDRWLDETGAEYRRAELEASEYGPVREVLLVSPAAGQLLEAAAEWQRRRAERGEPGRYSAEQYAEACAALESHLVWLRNLAPAHPVRAVAEHLDTVLAMVGDRAEPAPASVAADLTERGRCGAPTPLVFRGTRSTACCHLSAGHDGWHRDDQGTEWNEQNAAGPVPVPDSGPGWDRETINSICENDLGEPHPRTAQVRALLADRDRQAKNAETNKAGWENELREVEHLRGFLDRVSRELSTLDSMTVQRDQMARERDEARAELEARKGSEDSRLADAAAHALLDAQEDLTDPEVWPDRFGRWTEAQADAARRMKELLLQKLADRADELRSGQRRIEPATTDLPTEGDQP